MDNRNHQAGVWEANAARSKDWTDTISGLGGPVGLAGGNFFALYFCVQRPHGKKFVPAGLTTQRW